MKFVKVCGPTPFPSIQDDHNEGYNEAKMKYPHPTTDWRREAIESGKEEKDRVTIVFPTF